MSDFVPFSIILLIFVYCCLLLFFALSLLVCFLNEDFSDALKWKNDGQILYPNLNLLYKQGK